MNGSRQSWAWVRGRPLHSSDFPGGTPLNHFFAWNESTRRRDRRYVIACDLFRLMTGLAKDDAREAAVAHLSIEAVIRARRRTALLVKTQALSTASRWVNWDLAASTPSSSRRRPGPMVAADPGFRRNDAGDIAEGKPKGGLSQTAGLHDINWRTVKAARQTVAALIDSIGSASIEKHAAFFAAFEQLADEVDLAALARRRPRLIRLAPRIAPRRVLVIRLSALGDFVQALGPIAAIRRRHQGDHLSLLTTSALAGFARWLGLFDDVIVDRRPGPVHIAGWIKLRGILRAGRFDGVYDLQTSQRSAAYAWLLRPGARPDWSGVVRGCSHPHANLDRDRQHTIDKQTEQLLMAGIHPTPLPLLPRLAGELPQGLAARRFILLVPGSSPRHPAKRWPAQRFGMLAKALCDAGYAPVVIGAPSEAGLGTAIRGVCPRAIDLVGQTTLEEVAVLAQHAVLAIGNDTGVTHLAAAAGCPVIVLFSSATDPDWCAPRGRLVRILAVSDLNELTLERVLGEVRPILAEYATPAVTMEQPASEPVAGEGCS
jgi:ADP-heptose:LPS heptosyltransferase